MAEALICDGKRTEAVTRIEAENRLEMGQSFGWAA